MRTLLALKALLFVVLIPGSVAGYIPLLILRANDRLHVPEVSIGTIAAALLLVIGVTILLLCVWDFLVAGRGTLAPIDPPKDLVVTGMYRFTRNPMYCGVLTTIAGEAWLFREPRLLAYGAAVFAIVHLFIVLYEEPDLTRRFGASYEAYRRAVPRWGFTTRPYEQ